MKNVIAVAATEAEIAPFFSFLKENYKEITPNRYQNSEYSLQVLITGVGMMSACFALSTALSEGNFDFALQAGIAGSFDSVLELGRVVAVGEEQYGDLGAEDKDGFLPIFTLGFLDKNSFPFSEGKIRNPNPNVFKHDLLIVSAITVNCVSGTQGTIDERLKLFSPSLETMEGIAFHYVCRMNNIPFLQIRAVSNYVTIRNKAEWKIGEAIHNLNQFLISHFTCNSDETNTWL